MREDWGCFSWRYVCDVHVHVFEGVVCTVFVAFTLLLCHVACALCIYFERVLVRFASWVCLPCEQLKP